MMNFNFKKILAATTAFCALLPTSRAQEKIGDVVTTPNSAFMLVNEFDSPEKNDVFNYNLNIMQRQAGVLKAIAEKIAAEKDQPKKDALIKQQEKLEMEFKANDEAMRKNFAFATDRQYRFIFLGSNICTALTDAELSNLKSDDGILLDPLKIVKKGNANYYRLKSIDGIKENEELQRALNFSLSKKMNIDALRKQISETIDATAQMDLAKKISAEEMAMKENDKLFREKYGIADKKNYLIEISKSRLMLVLTPQELEMIKKQEQENKKNQAK